MFLLALQISHLNTKIVEDSEELASSQRAADSMRENFHKQVGNSIVADSMRENFHKPVGNGMAEDSNTQESKALTTAVEWNVVEGFAK